MSDVTDDFENPAMPLVRRVAGGARMVDADPVGAREVLIRAAADDTADPEFLEAVGKLLATCAERSTPLTEWDFRDMTDLAHDAYWEAM